MCLFSFGRYMRSSALSTFKGIAYVRCFYNLLHIRLGRSVCLYVGQYTGSCLVRFHHLRLSIACVACVVSRTRHASIDGSGDAMSTFDIIRALKEEISGLLEVRKSIGMRERQLAAQYGEIEAELNSVIKLRGFADAEIARKREVLKGLET